MRRLFWDVYLYRVDVLRLEYRKPLLWKAIRKTMASCEVELKVPLFRLYYFQPEPALSYTFDSYTPDDDEFEGVTMSSIATIPKKWPLPATQPLSTLARTAFPVSRAEKQAPKEIAGKIRASISGRFVPAVAMVRFGDTRVHLKKRGAKTHRAMLKAQRNLVGSKRTSGVTTKR
jgi:hypothetical protein